MSTKRFLGYNTDENSKLVINRMQEPIVVRFTEADCGTVVSGIFGWKNNGLHQEDF